MVKDNHIDEYLNRMDSSIQDKLWFLDKVITKTTGILDYGCADGTLLKEIRTGVMLTPSQRVFTPNWYDLIGYDNSPDMMARAKENTKGLDISFIEAPHEALLHNSCIVLSSVLHEIFSYQPEDEAIWELQSIFDLGAKYIAIRDMGTTVQDNDLAPTEWERCVRLDEEHSSEPSLLPSFEAEWGSIAYMKNLLHYFLKKPYGENWENELKENYFAVSPKDLLSCFERRDYDVVYYESYTLPHIGLRAHEEYGLSLPYPTHYKILYKRHDA